MNLLLQDELTRFIAVVALAFGAVIVCFGLAYFLAAVGHAFMEWAQKGKSRE